MTDEVDLVAVEPAAPPPPPPSRWGGAGPLRQALRWAGWLVAALLLALAGFLVFLHTPPGRQLIIDEVAKVAPASGLKVEVGGIEGSVLWSATFTDVKLRDADGTLFLEVPRVDLGWRPWKWFSSGLDVRHLVLSGGTLHAAPRLLPGDPQAPLLPDFDVRVGRLVVEDLTVAPGLFLTQQQYSGSRVIGLVGSLDISDGRARVDMRGDLGGADRLTVLLDAQPDAESFDLDVDYNAPAGGLLAGLAGSQRDLTVRVVGAGGWSDWQGQLAARQGDQPLIDARLTAADGLYRLAGQVWPGDNLAGLTARALGRQVDLTAEGTLAAGLVDGRFTVTGEGVALTGEGGLDFANRAFRQVQLAATLRDPALFGPDVRLDNARATGLLDGPFNALRLPHQITVGRVDAGGVVLTDLTQRGVLTANDRQVLIPVAASVARITSGNAMADQRLVRGYLTGALLLDQATNRLTSRGLDLRFPDLTARPVLTGDLNAGTLRVTGPVSARRLVFADIGEVDGTAEIDVTLGGGRPWLVRADVSGQASRLSNATIANLAGETIRFSGGLSLGAGRPISFTTMRLNGARLQAVLEGEVRGATTVLTGSGRQADYGPFTVSATLDGRGLNARLLLDDPYPAAGLRNVELVIAPEGDGFAIQTRGQSLLGAFSGDLGLVAPAGGPVRVAIPRFEVSGMRVTGNLALTGARADGALLLSGNGVTGRVGLAGREGGQGFDVALTARDAHFGGPTPLDVASADVNLTGFIAGERSHIEGTVRGQGIGYGQLFVGRMAANATVVDGRGHIDAALAGRRGSRFELLLNADVDRAQAAVAARGSFAGQPLSTPRRIVVRRLDGGGWQVERSQVSFAGGFLIGEGTFGGDGPARGQIALADMPLSLADALGYDLGLGGKASGVIDFSAPRGAVPTGEARLLVNGLTRSGQVLTSRPLDLAAIIRLDATSLRARAVMAGTDEARGRLDAQVTGLPAGGALNDRLYRGALAGTLTYNGPAESLWRLAAIDLIDISGPLRVGARLRGSLASPQLSGALSGQGLRVQSALTGSDVTGVTARGTFTDSRLQLTSFAGQVAGGGRVSGSGTLDLSGIDSTRGPRIDLRLAASNARILKLPTMAATVTGPLRIVSDGVNGTIAGRLQVRSASWRLGSASEVATLPDIAITEVNLPLDVRPALAVARPWRYLIDAQATRGIEVDGMGLDSEWGGAIRLRGTTADPRIGGSVRVVPRQGFYSFAGSRFEITRGIINFDESGPPDPRLDILAESDESGVDVDITVRGTASQAEIAFSSTPALPEEELLARLLFGGSITDISATDALQLGAALSSLRGGTGLDPINRLRNAVGLDRLRILPADRALDRGTAVALGKNVSRRFYVELVTDGQGYNATELEFRVTSWLSLLAAIDTVGRGRAEAVFSRDY